MPNSNSNVQLDWAAVGRQAFCVLTEQFTPLLQEGSAEAQARLELLSRELATYWAAVQAGGPQAEAAATNLKWLKAEMKLIIARYAVKANAAAQRTAAGWIEMLATAGSILLKGLVLA